MLKFIKRINWKKFWKYELYCFLFVGLLYVSSQNVFPENVYTIFLIPSIFGVMLLLGAHSDYLIKKDKKNEKKKI